MSWPGSFGRSRGSWVTSWLSASAHRRSSAGLWRRSRVFRRRGFCPFWRICPGGGYIYPNRGFGGGRERVKKYVYRTKETKVTKESKFALERIFWGTSVRPKKVHKQVECTKPPPSETPPRPAGDSARHRRWERIAQEQALPLPRPESLGRRAPRSVLRSRARIGGLHGHLSRAKCLNRPSQNVVQRRRPSLRWSASWWR
jgi:hypothetical protein